MALSKESVYEVEKFFGSSYRDHGIAYTGRNDHGADEVYICTSKSLSTRDLNDILAVSKNIGNTVSLVAITKGVIQICFW